MSVFAHPEYADHEQVVAARDPRSGVRIIVAIHSTRLGPAAGGARRWTYPSADAALADVLRLSRGMTYKNAMAGLPLGGGKAVILAEDAAPKSRREFEFLGELVASLGGRYVTAEDVGVGVNDMAIVAAATRHVSGLESAGGVGGDPSPHTAGGVLAGIRAAVRERLGRDRLDGVRVAVQGLGHVGGALARMLAEEGAELIVADLDRDRVAAARDALGAKAATVEELPFADADVLAPCALGGVLTTATVPRIRAVIVAGAANNQLADAAVGELLTGRGILYAPDYVINAGGVVSVAAEYLGADEDWVAERIDAIGARLAEIFARARGSGESTGAVADRMAEEILAAGRPPETKAAGAA